ncbi:MAG: VWA domain-containing protein, partial [Spirochaetales bacterium]
MNFEQPIVLWALAGLVPVVLLLIRAYLLGLRDIRLLIPAQERQNVERVLWFKWIVSSTATVLMFASIVIAIADPVWGEEDVESERSELDISIAFDVSRSMYAADVSPSRLDASRDAVSSLLDRFPDSRVGITVFRGGASRVLPVTGDRIALEYVLSTAGPGMITTPGTDLGAGIGEAIEGLPAG